jgi:hypothetical protein
LTASSRRWPAISFVSVPPLAPAYDHRLQELMLGDAGGELLDTVETLPRVTRAGLDVSYGHLVDDAVVHRRHRRSGNLKVGESGPTPGGRWHAEPPGPTARMDGRPAARLPRSRCANWRKHARTVLRNLHDIIAPYQPTARIDYVYPILFDLIDARVDRGA